MLFDRRQRDLLRRIWLEGPLSRSELHQRLELTPNGVGALAEKLLKVGAIRECRPEPSTGGRPRVPLEIDPIGRHVVGLSIARGRIDAVRLNLLGEPGSEIHSEPVQKAEFVVPIARKLLGQLIDRRTLVVGVSTPGFVDPVTHEILFSSATPDLGAVSLKPLYETAGDVPIVLENDMHAAGARWMLTHRVNDRSDILLVGFDDGELGATMMIAGRSNRGCVTAANELGHTRYLVETERCYCGQTGCLERICSTDFLHRQGATALSLAESIADYEVGKLPPLDTLMRLLANGLANAVNFVRPNLLVLASRLTNSRAFTARLIHEVRERLLVELKDRVKISHWDQPVASSAETSAWLALASIYSEAWNIPRP